MPVLVLVLVLVREHDWTPEPVTAPTLPVRASHPTSAMAAAAVRAWIEGGVSADLA
ncbi:hypothetical protein ABZ178_10570 [Streptomyces massasporeus]|uniref:hypothetical protein n=1 Tax=Streptomyces massasporeus TaxID=67324 RepID=UPI0033AB83F5